MKTYLLPEYLVERDQNRCIRCKVCVNQCTYDTYYYDAEDDVICSRDENCVNCQRCVTFCPANAITIRKNPNANTENYNWTLGAIRDVKKQAETGGVILTGMGCDKPAGYFVYGSSTIMVYTTGRGVHGFTLDPSVGEFLLSHPDIRIPENGKIYSVNESYWHYWDEPTQKVVSYFKSPNNKRGQPYSLRYIGTLVADFHRNLLSGGIFMYPADFRDPKKPGGKLRLMCEAAPLAMVVEAAGGMATDGKMRILDIEPQQLHQRVPLFIGSKNDVQNLMEIYNSAA